MSTFRSSRIYYDHVLREVPCLEYHFGLVRSVAAEDRQMNLVIAPEILSFCRRKMEEWDQKEDPDLCTRPVQKLVDQWSHEGKSGDLTHQSDQEDDAEGQISSRRMGWCPMQNQWVSQCLGGAEGVSEGQTTVGRGKRWEQGFKDKVYHFCHPPAPPVLLIVARLLGSTKGGPISLKRVYC